MRVVFKDKGELKGWARPRFNRRTGRVFNPDWMDEKEIEIEKLFFREFQKEQNICENCPLHGKCFLEKQGYRDPKIVKKKNYKELAKKLYPCLPLFGENPIRILMDIHKKMPAQTWSKKRKYENEGKPAPVKPDTDNTIKLYLDALNGVAYEDDKQDTTLVIQKRYDWTDSVKVVIEEDGGFNIFQYVGEYLMGLIKG